MSADVAFSFWRTQLGTNNYFDSACLWLKSNEATWRKWMPGKLLCLRGQGLFNLATDQFVEERPASWLENEEGASSQFVVSHTFL